MSESSKGRSRRVTILLILLILLALVALCGLLYVLNSLTRVPEKKPVLAEAPGVQLEFQAFGGSWGTTMTAPADIAYDGENRIYVTQPDASRIVYYDRNGEDGQIFVEDKYEPNHKATDFDVVVPYGIDVGDDGLVYVADTAKMAIVVFSPEGEKLREFGVMGARNVDVKNGLIYVTTELHNLVVLDVEGNKVGQWGTEGRGPDQLKDPNGVVADSDGNIYVSDMDNYRIIALDPELEVLWRFGEPSNTVEGHNARTLASPTGITLGPNGTLYVSDVLTSVIQVVTTDGKSASNPLGQMGNADDQFYFPRGIEWLDEDLFIVADTAHNRIAGVRLTPQEASQETP